MRLPVDVICNVCDSVFCCAECRYKHELKNHAILVEKQSNMQKNADDGNGTTTTIYLFCSLCEKKPLELREEMFKEMLDHIRDNHLPLHCVKCDKLYEKVEDLEEFSKCLNPTFSCNGQLAECSATTDQTSCTTDASKVTVMKDMHRTTSTTTMSTQTSPMRHDFNETHLTTPIAVINSRWKAKSKISHEEFISDSVSSIRNLSSISNSSIRRSIEAMPQPKGTLVRSTSTPVQVFYGKPKEQTFNATGGGQVSSIYTSHCEVGDNSPAIPNGASPKHQPMENMNRCYFKVGGRVKMSAVTPLRQVMSKSIQKAFAEHGAPPQSASIRPHGHALHGKKMFDSSDASGGHGVNGLESASPPALDLRLSPAVRRSQNRQQTLYNPQEAHSMNNPSHKNVIQPDIVLATESIVITRTHHYASNTSTATNQSVASSASSISSSTNNGSSVYKTCQSVEIITATTAELSEVNIQQEPNNNVRTDLGFLAGSAIVVPHLTPITRVQGAIPNKKLQFDTPQVKAATEQKSPHNEEVFFTPETTPVRKSKIRLQSSDTSPTTGNSTKSNMPRKLSNRFSPSRRPPLRNCSEHAAFSHVEDISDDYDDDEVFLPNVASTKQRTDPQEKENLRREQTKSDTTTDTTTVVKDSGRSWSLSSFMSSVMRLPVLKGKGRNNENDIVADTSNSILRRCSSIAGSMIRPQSIAGKEQTLKRKRTYTIDNHHSMFLTQLNHSTEVSPPTELSLNVSTKRLRIQGRKPIERMRRDT